MEPFKVFLERRARNPLRKQELADKGEISNIEHIDREKNNLSPETEEVIQNMIDAGVEPEGVEAYRQGKLGVRERELKLDFLRTNPKKEYTPITNYMGFKIYADKLARYEMEKNENILELIQMSIKNLVTNYRDIIPNRKPSLVIVDMNNLKGAKDPVGDGRVYRPQGLYHDRLIYIDIEHVGEPDLLVHEYAHFIADRIPRQTEPLLQNEYKKMLEEYIGKPTKRDALEGTRNAKMRKMVAKKLGLPTEYSTVNFHEWFAEIITHWKSMPNNKNTYRFKTMIKKVLIRL